MFSYDFQVQIREDGPSEGQLYRCDGLVTIVVIIQAKVGTWVSEEPKFLASMFFFFLIQLGSGLLIQLVKIC